MKRWSGILLTGYEVFQSTPMKGNDRIGLAVPNDGADTAFVSFWGILTHVSIWVAVIAFLAACVLLYYSKKGQQLQENKKHIGVILVIVAIIAALPFFIDLIQRSFLLA